MTVVALVCAVVSGAFSQAADEGSVAVSFNRDVRTILSDKCFQCHGFDENTREGELRLDVREDALKVIVPGDPERSELMVRRAGGVEDWIDE